MEKIDFVLLWVDGSDPLWLEEKNKYSPVKIDAASSASRYRDWDNLQYWFRGVEKFAPWVNNIYFITWGHLPKWLNKDHPKLKIVNHREFIPSKYLPTFNSNSIELNLHRINELSEQFVLFNDDMFLINAVTSEEFFRNGKIIDQFILNTVTPMPNMPIIPHTIINNTRIINKYFKKPEVFKENFSKIFNLKYGSQMIRTILLSSWQHFPGFTNPHLPQSHLKSTFEMLWNKEYDEFDATCFNKFRKYTDINHWLLRYWNLCSGNYIPRGNDFGRYFNIPDMENQAIDYIENKKGKTICINDTSHVIDFESSRNNIINGFNKILQNKSDFEK